MYLVLELNFSCGDHESVIALTGINVVYSEGQGVSTIEGAIKASSRS
jgi:hypothetical protein